MPDEVFEEWAAFYEIDPSDGERVDVMAGIIASTIANIHRDKNKKPDPFTVGDFAPDWLGSDNERHLKTQEELADATDATFAALKAIRALNGNIDRQLGTDDNGGRWGPEGQAG